nr:hypothetical protein [Delftia acidovorans]
MRSRTAKRPGPLLHQQRLHSARLHRRYVAQEKAMLDFHAATQTLQAHQAAIKGLSHA